MPTFTLSQKKAHDHQRHISITANAGSGKTSVLVSRYCDLVEYHRYFPQEVAAITFTEKAAAELRSRIAREFENRLSDESRRERWDQLKAVREKFPSAVVTTIHGFCSQLLREFPIECDVPPNFAVISGYERTRMQDSALMEAIERALADDPAPGFEDAYDTARRIGRERMENILRLMLYNREGILLSRQDGVLKMDRTSTLEGWENQVDAALRNMTLNAETRPVLHLLIGALKESLQDKATALLNEAESATSPEEFLQSINTLLRDILFTSAGSLRKRSYDASGDEFDSLQEPAEALQSALRNADDFLSAHSDPELHGTLYDDAQELLKIYDETIRLYDRRKDLANGLDFEDLQLKLYEALEKEDVRTKIAGRFRYIMVDEFQDTNELQYQIVRRMVRDLTDINLLCVVGDRKQSIYGFRGAEVEVFTRATEDIRKVNRDKDRGQHPLAYRREFIEADSREESLGEIRLDASFRLLPDICAYVNAVCSPVMRSAPGSGYGVEYEPLVCARRSAGQGHVEALLVRPEQKEQDMDYGGNSEESEQVEEAELIARRILKMVVNGEQRVWERPDGEEEERARAVRFSDVAILCRKRSTFAPLEKALRAKGIPFLTHGSSGYFRTQEVYDVVNFLRTLLNSRDDIALMGLLRSPFFAVSDAELYQLSLQPNIKGQENNIWSRSVRRAEAGEASEALQRAVEIISDDRAMASRIPVSLLLKRILERTGWRGAVIGAERGEQMLANVDKLIDMARDFESRGFTNLFDFTERVTAQIEAEEMEAEAAINSSRDAVRLMTMHGAKGLEFPVVFLPSLQAPPRTSTPPFFDKELGFGWNWSFNGVEYRPMITALMKLKRRQKEQAEEARLFYVAVTRARDMLVLSGEAGATAPSGNMLAWGLAPLGDLPEENVTVPLAVPRLGFLEEDGATITYQDRRQDIEILRDIPDNERYMPEGAPSVEFRSDMLQIGDLPARARGEIYSATQFLTYSQCPSKYYMRYRLGLPETLGSAWELNPSEKDSEDGTAFARLFREAAKKIGEMAGRDQQEEKIAAIIADILALEPLDQDTLESLRRRLQGTFSGLLTTPEAQEQLFPTEAATETAKELRIPVGNGNERTYILGVMDRLTRMQDGSLSFLQYKTPHLRDRNPEDVALSYLPQIRLYAWLVSTLNKHQRSIVGTVLFTEAPDRPQVFPFNRFDLVRIEDEIQESIRDIHFLSYSDYRRLPSESPHCPICPYWIEQSCLLHRT